MNPFLPLLVLLGLFGLVILVSLIRSVRIVPAQTALVVERLGKFSRTLEAGFHVLIPFIEKVRYKHNMKEQAVDVPAQDCFTLDNVKVQVDGVLYMQVVDPKLASYGIDVLVDDPLAATAEAKAFYGIDLISYDKLENLDALVVAVAHSFYKEKGLAHVAGKIVPGGCLIDVKAMFDPVEAEKMDVNFWRL